jgi:hypothetical protein
MPNSYEHTQKGGRWMYVFFILLVYFLIMFGITALLPAENGKYIGLSILVLLFGLFVWAFMSISSLTISIDQTLIHLCFGPGTFRKCFFLDQIAECKVSRNPFPLSCGIHWVFTGWLYNITSGDVVEVTFKNGKRAYLGTDEPEKLAAAIQSAIKTN